MQLPDSFTQPGEVNTYVSPLLRDLHWLRVPQRIEFRLAVLTYHCLNGTAPRYLADGVTACAMADISRAYSQLRSVSSALLEVPRSKHSTIGDQAFHVAAAKAWNYLPPSIHHPSLPQFRRALRRNYVPSIVWRRTSLNATNKLLSLRGIGPAVFLEDDSIDIFVYDDDDDDFPVSSILSTQLSAKAKQGAIDAAEAV